MRLRTPRLTHRSGAGGRVIAMEAAPDGWRTVEAELRGEEIVVLRAETLAAGREPGRAAPGSLKPGAECLLVVGSTRAVFRTLDLPPASRQETERAVALRLETELPYPVSESVWACERQAVGASGGPGRVMVLAAPDSEVSAAEDAVKRAGYGVTAVDLDAAAVAALFAPRKHGPSGILRDGRTEGSSLAWGRETGRDEDEPGSVGPTETLAILRVDGREALFVIAAAGRLAYVRRIPCSLDAAAGQGRLEALRRLAGDIQQSLGDYLLQARGEAPGRLVVVGIAASEPELVAALGSHLSIRVERGVLPAGVRCADGWRGEGGPADGVLVEYPACLGAVLAEMRRRRGQAPAAPLLRRGSRERAGLLRRRAALVALNLLALAGLLAAAGAVRATRLRLARETLEHPAVNPFLAQLETLEEEVRLLDGERANRRSVLDVLRALAAALPPGVTLASVTIDANGKMTLGGRAPSVEAASEQAVSGMAASPFFLNPRFIESKPEGDYVVFQIQCDLAPQPQGASQP